VDHFWPGGEEKAPARRAPHLAADRRHRGGAGRRSIFGEMPDMTPKEHRRRGDAADALFREMVRRAASKD
jgi:hypothetical protein